MINYLDAQSLRSLPLHAELGRSLREALPARDNDAVGAALNQQPGHDLSWRRVSIQFRRTPHAALRLAADIDSLGALALGTSA